MGCREERAAGCQRPADPTHHASPEPTATTDDDASDIRQVEAEQEFRDEQARQAADALERRQGDIASVMSSPPQGSTADYGDASPTSSLATATPSWWRG